MEVIDCVTISQFESGESQFECVCYAVATCHYGGKPGQGPTGSPEQVDQLADEWYAKLTGSLTNQQGLSVNQELQMILGVGNHYQQLPIEPNSMHDRDIANVKGALLRDYPVIICGAETGMVDAGLGGVVPYSWAPYGNHCIVATGIAKDGNLLVRDPANVVGNTPRTQPRTYQIASLDLVSGVVFVPPWMNQPSDTTDWTSAPTSTGQETIAVNITDPSIATYFEVVGGNSLKRKDTGVTMGSGLSAYYLKYGGVATFRLPISGEIPVTDANNQPIPRLVYVIMESGILVYDPEQKNPDHPPTKEPCYLMRIDSGPGQRLIAKSLLQAEQTPSLSSAKQEIVNQIKTLAASL